MGGRVISYGRQTIDEADVRAVVAALKSEWLTQGPLVAKFEKRVAEYVGAAYAVAVANGTAALHLAVLALELEAGFEGITTPMTFVASANCILYGGGKVKFCDIEGKTGLMDVEKLEKAFSAQTKVVIPVHYAGQSCEMRTIRRLAKERKAYVIEDAAHAIGSFYRGKKVGSCEYSDMCVFSFHPVKTMTTGEGGMITTNNKGLYENLVQLRTHGITKDRKKMKKKNPEPWWYEMQKLGFNYRLTDLQAALGASQMRKLDRFVDRRRKIVEWYRKEFEGDDRFMLLAEHKDTKAAWHLCPVLIDFERTGKSKRELFEWLGQKGIRLQVHYIPVHLQPYYQKLGFRKDDFPAAEKFYEWVLSLPLYPGLTRVDVRKVCKLLRSL